MAASIGTIGCVFRRIRNINCLLTYTRNECVNLRNINNTDKSRMFYISSRNYARKGSRTALKVFDSEEAYTKSQEFPKSQQEKFLWDPDREARKAANPGSAYLEKQELRTKEVLFGGVNNPAKEYLRNEQKYQHTMPSKKQKVQAPEYPLQDDMEDIESAQNYKSRKTKKGAYVDADKLQYDKFRKSHHKSTFSTSQLGVSEDSRQWETGNEGDDYEVVRPMWNKKPERNRDFKQSKQDVESEDESHMYGFSGRRKPTDKNKYRANRRQGENSRHIQEDVGDESESEFTEHRDKGRIGHIPKYEKLDEHSTLLGSAMIVARSASKRAEKKEMMLEGWRLIKDALDAGVKVNTIFFSKPEILQNLGLKEGDENNPQLYKVFYKKMKIWSDMVTPPGIMAIAKIPAISELQYINRTVHPITVICDNIREPGNLGAILRCAAAAGCEKVLLTKGCVDPWDSKVLRSASGAHFHVEIRHRIEWDTIENFIDKSSQVFLATNQVREFSVEEGSTFEHEKAVEVEYYDVKFDEITGEEVKSNPRYNRPSSGPIKLPNIMYHDADFSSPGHVVFVIGGETHGLSVQARMLAANFGGRHVTIPLYNHVDSLNSGAAISVLLYEMLRQRRPTATQSDNEKVEIATG